MEAIRPAVWAVGQYRLADRRNSHSRKLYNLTSNLFFECLNRFLALLTLYQ